MQYEGQFSDLVVSYGVKTVSDITVPVCRPSSLQCCTENVFVYSSPKYIATISYGILDQYNYKLNAILFIDDLNIYAGITQGTPYLIFYDNVKGLPQISEEFRIDMTTCESLFYFQGKILVLGTNLNVYDISIHQSLEYKDHPIDITKLFTFNFPQVKLFQKVYYDEFYNRFVIPTLHGFSVITLDGQVVFEDYNLTLNFAKSSSCFICKPKNFVKSTVQREPFKKLAILNPDGSINIYNRILQIAKSISLPGVIFNYLEFISNQFILLLTDFEIYILDIKTLNFLKVYTLKEKYEAISYNKDLKHLVLMSNTKFYSFAINIPWILWKGFTSSINLIKLQISSQTSPKICFLHENLFLTFANPDTAKVTSSMGISGRDQIINIIYDRGVAYENDQFYSTGTSDILSFETMTEKLFIFRDNYTIEQYQSIDEAEFIHLSNLPVPTKAMCIGIYKDIPCIYCVSKKGDLLSYKYENLEQMSRSKLKYTDVISIHYHYSTNRLWLAFQNCLTVFDPTLMSVIRDIPEKDIYLAEFEGSYLFLANNEKVQIFNLQTDFDLCLEFPISDKIKGVSLLKESFVCYTSENMVIFGKPSQLIGRLQSPFEINSIYLLNSKFDILISIGKYVMIFHALEFYPNLYLQLTNSVSRREQRILNKISRKQSRKTQRSEKVKNYNETDRNQILNEITAIENKGFKEKLKEQTNNKDAIKKKLKVEEEEKRKQTEEKISMKFESRKQLKGILHHLLSSKDIPSEGKLDKVKGSRSQPINLVLSNQTNDSCLTEDDQKSNFFTTEVSSQKSDEKKVLFQTSSECHHVQTPSLSSNMQSPRTKRNKSFMQTICSDNGQHKFIQKFDEQLIEISDSQINNVNFENKYQIYEKNQQNKGKTNQFKELTNDQDKELTNDQDKELTNDQDKELTNDQDKELTNDQDKELTNDQDKELTNDQDKELTNDQLKDELIDQDKELTNDQDKELTNDQLKDELIDQDSEITLSYSKVNFHKTGETTLQNITQLSRNKNQNCDYNSQGEIQNNKEIIANETYKNIERNQSNEFNFNQRKVENTMQSFKKFKQNKLANQSTYNFQENSFEETQNNTEMLKTKAFDKNKYMSFSPQNEISECGINSNVTYEFEPKQVRKYPESSANKNLTNKFDHIPQIDKQTNKICQNYTSEWQEGKNAAEMNQSYEERTPIQLINRRITYDGFIPDNENTCQAVHIQNHNTLKRRYSVGQYQKGYSEILHEQEITETPNNENLETEDDIVTDAADLMSQIEMANRRIDTEFTKDLEYKKLPSLQTLEQPSHNKIYKFDLSPRSKFLTTPADDETPLYSVNSIPPHKRSEHPRKVSFDPNGIPPPDPHQSPLYRVISNYKAPSRRNQRRSRVSRQTLIQMMFPSRNKQRTPLSPIGGRGINNQIQKQNRIMDLNLMKNIVNQNRQRKLKKSDQNTGNHPLDKMFKIIQPKSENFSQKFFKRK
ncbi:hypothetical protein TVAG_405890 [Trichomonas vaginalis G3]|uniref:Uncharacterized protein n=1 Tax=Trichomonas vaginalis (strain ATCC PRA-98 / G3) TaxID=412133 RepID=A2DV79_TRIV3|nr:transmembrane protein TMEM238 family [Trichomonas vaginalis G3]EAY15675.1 hypothetical protein TVAG_405890 [Trichomonas vaginalis G3]KAI5504525.1 transmembrane protein TMEM238 family [Trichomonas vaginalis G3]|eukprot:XP_001327898.1 hypothetical protein [Trichomonas vaginalis G3]